MNRNFFVLWSGQFVSLIGNQAFAIALMFWIKHATGSASIMGFLMMASMIPSVILGPIGGVFADRHSRRNIIILSDLISGIAVVALSLVMFYVPGETTLILVTLFIVAIIVSVAGSFFQPAISAAIPDLVSKDKISRANSLNQSSVQISVFIGQGLGGIMYRICGAPLLFLIDGLTYLVATACESFVKIPQVVPQEKTKPGEVYKHVRNDLKEGYDYIRNKAGLKVLFTVFAFLNFFSMPFILFLPFYVEDVLKVAPDWYGYLLAAFGGGTLAGYIIIGLVKLSGKTKSRLFLLLLFVMSIALASLGFIRIAFVSLLVVFVTGVIVGVINLMILNILQISTPTEIRGRVFGLMVTITRVLSPLAMGVAGITGDLMHKNIPLIFLACGGGLILISLLVLMSREFRDFIAHEHC